VARKAVDDMKRAVDDIMVEFNQTPFTGLSFEQMEAFRAGLTEKIDMMGRQSTELLERIRDMLLPVSEALTTGSPVGQLEMMEATEQELLVLRDRSTLDAEMVQLGMAVAIINHEFKAAAIKIRNAVRGLRKWATANQDLTPIYQAISENFAHLDAHLALFTPLQRRLYRKPVVVNGRDINHYVAELFSMRLARHAVSISTTEAFRASQTTAYPSTVYPVFVNLVDNAVYWLASVKDRPREITFDAASDGWIVRDTGPGIDRRDHDAVFERGFTRKPGGRGLGLFISREALRKEGMDISVEPSITGACFKIVWKRGAENK
jgi:signal transduction histidine kinase